LKHLFFNTKIGFLSGRGAPREQELQAQLLALERQEECFVMMALAAGIKVHRRIHASGWAVLNIEPGVVEENDADTVEAAE
jgi:hypothetical protein